MAFTNMLKKLMSFGGLYSSSSIYSSYTGDRTAFTDSTGNIRYYASDMCLYSSSSSGDVGGTYDSVSSGASSVGWIASKEQITNDSVPSNSYVRLVKVSTNGLTIRVSCTNETSSDIVLNSIIYLRKGYFFNDETGSNTTATIFIGVYYNFPTPITVPANDSVFIDITLSAGDVSEVSVG